MTEFISEFRKGQALQFNWLYEKGALVLHSDGKFSVDFTKVIFYTFNYLFIFSYHCSLEFVLWKVEEAVESLSREILTIQAKGDKPSAQSLLQSRATLTQPLRVALEKIHSWLLECLRSGQLRFGFSGDSIRSCHLILYTMPNNCLFSV